MAGGGNLDNVISPEDLSNPKIYYTSCVHNCGTGIRCVSKLHVVNGRIVRVTSDDSDTAFDGSYRNKEQINDARSLTCPKGRAIKYRAHHPAKLRYALKQTKQRGDLSGFVRISVDDALKEIAQKYRATVSKYGPGAVHNIYGTSGGYSSQGTYASYSSTRSALTPAGARSGYGDYSYYQYHFGSIIVGHPGSCGAYTKSSNVAWQFPAIAGVVKNVVSWGANILTTVNSAAWSYIRAFEKLKENGGKAYFIGPELTDTGVTCHTDWIQSRNYTDVALIMGMLYEMLVNTFNKNGEVQKSSKALDVDYIDTMVHGFFASPEYYINTAQYTDGTDTSIGSTLNANIGEITSKPADYDNWKMEEGTWYIQSDGTVSTSRPTSGTARIVNMRWVNGTRYSYDYPAYRHIEAVEAGKCLASYILGGDVSIIGNPTYNANSTNYTAKKYHEISPNLARVGKVTYPVSKVNNTEYQYKKDFKVAKTPEWAEKITGVPASKIRELANMYTDPDQHPIFNEWAGGTQKQLNGSIQLWAITALMAITKTFGLSGETFGGAWATTNSLGPIADTDANNYIDFSGITVGNAGVTTISDRTINSISCKEWFNGIKIAFKDYLTAERGYTGENIPDWDINKRYYSNDGGVKSLVMFEKDTTDNTKLQTEVLEDGKTYYKVKRDANGEPIYSGIRMILNAGGGIMVNQHMNTNDLTAMYKAIPALNSNEGGTYTNADGLCLVTFDLFMSPTARYMDYVLPAVSQLEAVGREAFGGQSKNMYRPPVVEPLGDALDSWTMTYKAWVAQSQLGEYTYDGKSTSGISSAPMKYTDNSSFKPIRNYFDAEVDKAISEPTSKFYGMTRDEVYGAQFTPAKNNDEYICKSYYETRGTTTSFFDYSVYDADTKRNTTISDSSTKANERDTISKIGQIRKNLDDYLKGDKSNPFVFTTENEVQNKFDGKTVSYFSLANDNSARPEMSGKFQIYNGRVQYDYEHAFEMYHGWLPAENRGQENKDAEGDLKVYPIPMYFNFEDCFKESYNGFNNVDSATGEAKQGKNARFFTGTDKPLTMSTTHDRFRVHSTHDENPLLRELNHRTIGGGWASGNDWKEYCIVPERQIMGSNAAYESPMISTAIYKKNKETASWHEIWINTQDAAERGITDGMLCRVENPIGKVRVIARVTDRCIPGHLNLHQGGWYDPNTDGVDDGGNANTLIASTPSRYDHGNAQQSAYVIIKPETEFNI